MKSRISRWVLLLVAVLSVTAMLWPVEVVGMVGQPELAVGARSKMKHLLESISTGNVTQARFSEQEINAHLDRLVDYNAEARQTDGLTLGLEDLHCDINDDGGTLFVTVRFLRLPVVLAFQFAQDDSAEELDYRAVKVGSLPLVQPFKLLAINQLERMVAGLVLERRVLEHTTHLEVGDDEVLLAVGSSRI